MGKVWDARCGFADLSLSIQIASTAALAIAFAAFFTRRSSSFVAQAVGNSRIIRTPGIDVIGELPADLQKQIPYSAGIATKAEHCHSQTQYTPQSLLAYSLYEFECLAEQ
jgi:hypothetical protein